MRERPQEIQAERVEKRAMTMMACEGLSLSGNSARPSRRRRTGGERAKI